MPVVSVNAEAIPMIHTETVSTLISDSGITRYHLEAKVWDMYSNAAEPYWYFPEGIYVERFDSLFAVEGYLKADSACYLEQKDLWKAMGNVFVKNLEGSVFETDELYWEMNVPPGVLNAFRTDKPVRITYPNGDVFHGKNGFRADQSLSEIRLYGNSGEMTVDETVNSPQDSIQK
jgi:hypothetical protein